MRDESAPRFAVEIEYMRRVRWSLLRIGWPLIRRFSIRLLSPASRVEAVGISVRVRIPGLVDTGRQPLTACADALGIPPWDQSPGSGMVDFEQAMCLLNARDARLELQVGTYSATLPITLLTPDEWCPGVMVAQDMQALHCNLDSIIEWARADLKLPPGGAKSARTFLAPPDALIDDSDPATAFVACSERGANRRASFLPLQAAASVMVQPDHPLVAQLKSDALRSLPALTGDPHASLLQLLGDGGQSRRKLVQALYVALADRYGKAVHDLPSFCLEERSQRIRFSDQAMGEGPRHGATCVDFALVFCSLLLKCGLDPLLVVVATGPGFCHALVGCWLNDETAGVMIETDGRCLRRLVAGGNLLIIDVTAFTRGAVFDAACQGGADLLLSRSDEASGDLVCYALDIGAVLSGNVRPLPLPQCGGKHLLPRRRVWLATLGLIAAGAGWFSVLDRSVPLPPCVPADANVVRQQIDLCRLQPARDLVAGLLVRCPADPLIGALARDLNSVLRGETTFDLVSGEDVRSIPLGPGAAVVPIEGNADGFRLNLTFQEPAHVYVFGIDRGGAVETLFPSTDTPAAPVNPLGASTRYTLPTAGAGYVYALNGPQGEVTEVAILASRWPLHDIAHWSGVADADGARRIRETLAACSASGPAPWYVARLRFQPEAP